MGLAKARMMENEFRGYGNSGKSVCSECIGNKHLKQFVINNGAKAIICDFCKTKGICVKIEEICGEIINGISIEYEKAIESMYYVSREGGYQGATTWSTSELLIDINDEMELEPDVVDELIDIIDDDTWCKRDPYGLPRSKEQLYMWQRFSEMVKHQTRYVFFRMPERNKNNDESDYLILDRIGEAVSELDLIRTVSPGHHYFRGRTHEENIFLHEVTELCSPPEENSQPNRMSAEGISVFYGADDPKTALIEIDYGDPAASVASFENLTTLQILDLTNVSNCTIPSLFDVEQRNLRESTIFLKSLNKDLTRNIDEMKAIEYIPAQVVAEYFRYLYTFEGKPIDGIAYNSSKCPDGICYILFFHIHNL